MCRKQYFGIFLVFITTFISAYLLVDLMGIKIARAGEATPIYDWDGVIKIKNDLSGKYILMNDLDFNDYQGEFEPIMGFLGTFDGNNKIIKNFKLDYTNSQSEDGFPLMGVGLFGLIGSTEDPEFPVGAPEIEAVVKNIHMVNASVKLGGYHAYNTGVSLLVGIVYNGIIVNSTVEGTIIGVDSGIVMGTGLLAGTIIKGSIDDCSARGAIEINSHEEAEVVGTIGLLVGAARDIDMTDNQAVTITNSSARGTINITHNGVFTNEEEQPFSFIGLLTGIALNNINISNSSAIGDIILNSNVEGGVVQGVGLLTGYLLNSSVDNSLARGSVVINGNADVSESSATGLLVGGLTGSLITNSLATGQIIINRSAVSLPMAVENLGLLTGFLEEGVISNSLASGEINIADNTGKKGVGLFLGLVSGQQLHNSHYYSISDYPIIGILAGDNEIEGVTKEEVKEKFYLPSHIVYPTWDQGVWYWSEVDFPQIREKLFIEARADQNGNITPEGRWRVGFEDDQSFKIIADPGYKIDKITVNDIDYGADSNHDLKTIREDQLIVAYFKVDSAGSPGDDDDNSGSTGNPGDDDDDSSNGSSGDDSSTNDSNSGNGSSGGNSSATKNSSGSSVIYGKPDTEAIRKSLQTELVADDCLIKIDLADPYYKYQITSYSLSSSLDFSMSSIFSIDDDNPEAVYNLCFNQESYLDKEQQVYIKLYNAGGHSTDPIVINIKSKGGLITEVDQALVSRLLGRILLQTEDQGQAWYLSPLNGRRYLLGRPHDAFEVMKKLSLGISEINFSKFNSSVVPQYLSGYILIRPEANGEAYYVNPNDLKLHYLGRPDNAFKIIRELSLGISSQDLSRIEIGTIP